MLISAMNSVDPLYPVYIGYKVSQHIWDLYELYLYNVIMAKIGKQQTFAYLRWRYEQTPRWGPLVILFIIIHVGSWLFTALHSASRENMNQEDDEDQDEPNLAIEDIVNIDGDDDGD